MTLWHSVSTRFGLFAADDSQVATLTQSEGGNGILQLPVVFRKDGEDVLQAVHKEHGK